MKLVYLFLICLIKNSQQKSSPEDNSYVAAVLEYNFTSNSSINIQNYLGYIQDAALQNADIVVFPEMTLTRGRPIEVPLYGRLKDYPVPAAHPGMYDEVLVSLSAAALQHQLYVVVNLEERLNCTSEESAGELCPQEKVYIFNTNIVFDRTGAVIDRYRKINLFGEYSRTPALRADLGAFSTDFGVTFGHFICFDLMFQVPAVQVVQKLNITDVVFTTMWFSEMPFLTAVQIQEAYAYAMDVNFLASGANNVRVGSAGSGIFSGKAGALISTMPGTAVSRLLVSKVPKVPGQLNGIVAPGPIIDPPSEADGLRMKQDPSLKAHASQLLVPGFQEFVLSQKEVSCRFRVRLSQRNSDKGLRYRALVHDGSNHYARRDIGTVSCAVVACQSDDIMSCPYMYKNSEVQIEELKIEMNIFHLPFNNTLKCDNVVYYPSTLQSNKYPLSSNNFTFTEILNNKVKYGRRLTLNMELSKPQDDLVNFAIWGRIFTRDVDYVTMITDEDVENALEIEDKIFDALGVDIED